MNDKQIRIVLNNDLSEIRRLGRELENFGVHCGLSEKVRFELNLIMEEIVANVISYAYEDCRRHEILVRAALEKGELAIEVVDDGRPFNPLTLPPREFSSSLEDTKVGGLGLHLVKKLTDSLDYERIGGTNRLLMRKKTTSGSD